MFDEGAPAGSDRTQTREKRRQCVLRTIRVHEGRGEEREREREAGGLTAVTVIVGASAVTVVVTTTSSTAAVRAPVIVAVITAGRVTPTGLVRAVEAASEGIALRRAVVSTRGRGASATATGLVDVDDAVDQLGAAQAGDGSLGFLGRLHHDEAKATRLLGVRVTHDLALLDLQGRQTRERLVRPRLLHCFPGSGRALARGGKGTTTYTAVLGKGGLEVALLDLERETRDVQVVTRVLLGSATLTRSVGAVIV